ncbi:MAG: hypothetical protein ACXVC2_12495, partial [Bacteroidia bacterium]
MKTTIKTLAAATAIVLFSFTCTAHDGNNKNKHTKADVKHSKDNGAKKTEHIIEMSSVLTVKGIPAGNYDLFLSLDGNLIDTLKVCKAKPIFFDLEQNQ